MSNLKKYTDLLTKVAGKSAEKLGSTSRDISRRLADERKKLEIRSQIGQHERQITKAYERLGEAYYEHVHEGRAMEKNDDILEVIRSNKKVISLLEEQIRQLES